MRGINLKLPYMDSNYEKPSKKTDQLVDQTFLSFSLDQDPGPDSKVSANMLRSFSAIGHDTSDHKIPLEHYLKLEEDLKEKTHQIKDLQFTNTELKHLIKQLQEEKDEIVNVNIKLTKELENTIEKYEKLTVLNKKHKLASPKSNNNKEILKYATFISQKCKILPEIRVYFQDRLDNKDLIDLAEKQKEKALLISLQVISDIIVHNIPESKSYQPRSIIQENEQLMHSISEHNLRMARLNREIAKNAIPESIKRKPDCSNSSSPFYET